MRINQIIRRITKTIKISRIGRAGKTIMKIRTTNKQMMVISRLRMLMIVTIS